MSSMKKLWVECGNGITIFHQGHEILKLIFSVDKAFERIEVISMTINQEVEIKEGVVVDKPQEESE